MATHSSILAWETTWTEEPGWLRSMGSQGVGQNEVTYHACCQVERVEADHPNPNTTALSPHRQDPREDVYT